MLLVSIAYYRFNEMITMSSRFPKTIRVVLHDMLKDQESKNLFLPIVY